MDRGGAPRPFVFEEDTFAYTNELVWVYRYEADGGWVTEKRVPEPEYAQRCFAMARGAQQFLRHARFDTDAAGVDAEELRRRVREVLGRNTRRRESGEPPVILPGVESLRVLSETEGGLLKTEGGGGWRSYVQRGHWRMVFPFTRSQQAGTARKLIRLLERDSTVVLHLARFPELTINHAVLAYGFAETEAGTDFLVYDPNDPGLPVRLRYEHATRTFYWPASHYFPGGRVDVYPVYHHWAF